MELIVILWSEDPAPKLHTSVPSTKSMSSSPMWVVSLELSSGSCFSWITSNSCPLSSILPRDSLNTKRTKRMISQASTSSATSGIWFSRLALSVDYARGGPRQRRESTARMKCWNSLMSNCCSKGSVFLRGLLTVCWLEATSKRNNFISCRPWES